ncbi:SPT3 Dosage dependent suppressor of Ty-induced promoter mutations-like protein [Tulasnella sp. UAMH 9824]|nr:SPT3 Dosage dependent suppressor of Ty-induced promoter mutations-like protein [Tulasnella sp. UAMH 9824]
MASTITRTRSPSPPSSNDSPPTSHSSPASSDFQSPDNGLSRSPPASDRFYSPPSHLKLNPGAPTQLWSASAGVDFGYSSLLGGERHPSELLDIIKSSDDQEGLNMMGFIRKESYDPTPMSVISPQAMYLPHTLQHDATGPPNNHKGSLAGNGPSELPSAHGTSPSYSATTGNTFQSREVDQTATRLPTTFDTQGPNTTLAVSAPTTSQAAQSLAQPPLVEPIFPPKNSCSNLHILVPNLPERGAKSRVETQIKIDIELSMLVSEPGASSAQVYRPVGSWKWLRLSKGSSTKRRAKKDVKQESTSAETLYLSTEVYCATAPHPRVHACSSCIAREVKKNERKKATRVRPVPEDSSDDEASRVPQIVVDQIRADEKEEDDGSRIVLFNCPDLMEFNTGRASLPVRVTCYCRHHREKIGFRILLTLRDSLGRIVGQGYTPPIMITDDHKSTQKSMAAEEEEADLRGQSGEPSQKRKRKATKREFEQDGDAMMDIPLLEEGEEDDGSGRAKRKLNKAGVPGGRKPSSGAGLKSSSRNGYASGRSSRLGTPSRRSSPLLASRSFTQPSPSTPYATVQPPPGSHGLMQSNTQLPTNFDFNAMAAAAVATSPSDSSNLQAFEQPEAPSAEALLAACEGISTRDGGFGGMTLHSGQQQQPSIDLLTSPFSPYQRYPASSPSTAVTAPTSPLNSAHPLGSPTLLDPSLSMLAGSLLATNIFPHPPMTASSSPGAPQSRGMSMLTQVPTSATDPGAFQTVPPPVIHRLIPNQGPMRGGIEVTILGSNFTSNLQCTFGDIVSSQTTMWSENTIVCLLPASPSPGPVVVWFKDVPLGVNTMGLSAGGGVDAQFGLNPGNSLQFFTYADEADRALMELALQVVGLKMTGRIGQAKDIAMRIVSNNTGMDMNGGLGGGVAGGSQLADVLTSSLTAHRSPIASRRTSSADLVAEAANQGTSRDFQSSIISLLSVADVDIEVEAPTSIPLEEALTLSNSEGQTLLHLASILGFHRLIKWLLEKGADVDARDKNGFTALHFSASSGRLACARLLLEAGADLQVVDGRGRSARQLAHLYDQPDVEALLDGFESRSESPVDEDYEGDAGVSGSGEDEEVSAEEDTVWMGRRDSSLPSKLTPAASDSATPRSHGPSRIQSALPSRTGSNATFGEQPQPKLRADSDLYSSSDEDNGEQQLEHTTKAHRRAGGPVLHDPEPRPNKKADRPASWIHRYLAPPPAIIPDWNFPNVQMPGINFPNVQMPGIMAFPMQVPWPASFNWQGNQANEKAPRMYYDLSNWRNWYGNAAIGWRWEKAAQRPEVPPVPMYTPNADEVAEPVAYEDPIAQPSSTGGAGPSKAMVRAKLARRLGADGGHVTDKEVQAYTHYSQKMRRLKQDRMLFLFWLPILLIVIAWGLYENLPVAFGALKASIRHLIPFRDPLHA